VHSSKYGSTFNGLLIFVAGNVSRHKNKFFWTPFDSLNKNSTLEEEEEGTGVARDVVKVKGEDPAAPGPLI